MLIVSSVSVALLTLFSLFLVTHEYVLLFPASSVLQITSSVAAPVVLPERKVFMDWGFQFNFDLPWNPKSFYALPTFEDTLTGRSRRSSLDVSLLENWTNTSSSTNWPPLERYQRNTNVSMHSSDFTAGELYHSFENMLVRYGFHETCLLRSVCELARHPFADDQQNMITEVLTFLLTPSLHDGFSAAEYLYREVYEQAERHGFQGDDCVSLYDECEYDIFNGITKIMLLTS